MLKTMDGGETWLITSLPTTNDLNDIRFFNDKEGMIVGYREIWKSTDQGNTWFTQYANQNLLFPVFYAIEPINKDTIFITGVDGENGRILKTTDGGNHWISQSFSQWMRFDIKFVNDSVGFHVGSNSDIYKTLDGGESWTNIADPGIFNNRKLSFINDTVGYTAGYNGHILSTKDGGLQWSLDTTNTTKDLYWIHFINESRGFAVGDSGTILQFTRPIQPVAEMDEEGNPSEAPEETEEEEEVVTATSLKQEGEFFHAFPNPANDYLSIKLKNFTPQNFQLSIWNDLGTLVYQEQISFNGGGFEKKIPIADLPIGLYFVLVKTSSKNFKKKILIK